MARCLVISAVAAGLLAFGVHIASQRSFPVFTKGGVLVTGASSGIGLHAAVGLSAAGYTAFVGVRSKSDGDRIRAEKPSLLPVLLDVTKPESIAAALAEVRQHLEGLGLPLVALVNNAGVQSDMPVELQSAEADRWVFDVNVLGLLAVTRAFLPLLRAAGPGARVVNVGSLAGLLGSPGSATYVGSKFAVEGISDCLRQELQGFGISVSVIEPGYIVSRMAEKAHAEDSAPYLHLPRDQYELYRDVFEGFFANDRLMASPALASSPQVGSGGKVAGSPRLLSSSPWLTSPPRLPLAPPSLCRSAPTRSSTRSAARRRARATSSRTSAGCLRGCARCSRASSRTA